MGETAILILAAGASRRMGHPKQTLRVGARTLLDSVVHECIQAEIGPVFLVTGAYEGEVKRSVSTDSITLVHNPFWEEGMGSSLAKGVESIVDHAPFDQILLVLGDQYKLTSDSLHRLIVCYRSSEKTIGISVFEGGSGPPAIFSRKWFPELMKLRGEEGARPLVRAHRSEVVQIELSEAGADLDTPEDYQKLHQP